MSWFTALKAESLHDLFVHKLKTAYDVEQKQLDAMPKMAEAATDPELRAMFERHLAQSSIHIQRLERIFGILGVGVESDTCAAMRGLVTDGDVARNMRGDAAVRDAALILAVQCVEHHELALYGSLRTWAQFMGQTEIADLLQQTLDEEGGFDKQLTALAESSINQTAAH